MKVGFLITNGGPHPADKWAEQTTASILELIQVTDNSETPQALAARQAKRDLVPKVFAVLHKHHDGTQQLHRADLRRAKVSHVLRLIDVTPHMSVSDQVFALLGKTPFAAHFAQAHVQEVVNQIIGQHTADVIHTERKWHEDGLNARKGA